MKPLLLISRSAPWSSPAARETLDIALAGGAFDLPVSMLWQGDGVYQLLGDQQPQQLQQKNLQAQLSSLPLFGVEQLFVCSQSLEQRGLIPERLAIPARPVGIEEIRQLLAGDTQVLVI